MAISATPGPTPHGTGPKHAGRTLRRLLPALAAVIRHLPSLRLVVTASAGLDHIDLVECRRRGIAIAIANAAAIFSVDVADLAVGLLLDVMRRISAGDRYLKDGLWPKQRTYPLGYKLGGKRVGIVGLGSIGLEVAKRLEAFGCDISYISRNKKPSVSYAFYPDIRILAASTSDILVLCCALTEQTHRMINRDVLLALGKEGFIVSIVRGAVIDENELVASAVLVWTCLKTNILCRKSFMNSTMLCCHHMPVSPRRSRTVICSNSCVGIWKRSLKINR